MVCLLALHSTPSYGLPNYSPLLAAPSFYSGSSLFFIGKVSPKNDIKIPKFENYAIF